MNPFKWCKTVSFSIGWALCGDGRITFNGSKSVKIGKLYIIWRVV